MRRNLELDVRAAAFEFLSNGLFLYFGLGTAVLSGDFVVTSLVFGFAVAVLVYISQHSNAGQLNPAITIALGVTGYISYVQVAVNILAQCLSAVAACGLLRLSIPENGEDENLGANHLKGDYSAGNAVAAEIVCTFALQLTVFEAMLHPRNRVGKLGPLAVGLVVFIVHGVLTPIDNCSVNPARSLGPALLTNTWDDFWVFVVGPIVGALLAIIPHVFSLSEWNIVVNKTTTTKSQQIENPSASSV